MNKSEQPLSRQAPSVQWDLPDLPRSLTTRNGAKFDPREDVWAFRDATKNLHLDFSKIQGGPMFVASAKRALLWYAENSSSHHLQNLFFRLEHFCRTVQFSMEESGEIKTWHLINYRSSLTKRVEWYFSVLSGLFKKWHQLGYPGISREAVGLLGQWRGKGNIKGEAVQTMDPTQGPFSDIERSAINARLEDGYASGLIPLERYVLALLFLGLGQRSVQYCSLKLKDLTDKKLPDGTIEYLLKMPRAKHRDLSRAQFKDRLLEERLGKLLVAHRENVKIQWAREFNDVDEMPMFPANDSRRNEPPGFMHHRTSESLSITLEKTIDALEVVSERTGEFLNINATRFRRTVGTLAATEGHGALVIAELLDHTDTQNIGVYINARPEIVERIDRAIALEMAPLAQAFSGVIVEREADATRGNDPESRILDPKIAPINRAMGTCGEHGFCGLLAPIACYTCRNFQPWLEGPHESVLSFLLNERERLKKDADLRIASISDRTILAVAYVVRKCKEIKEQAGGSAQ